MPTYLSPGVYVEEVSSGTKPIEGVGTAICAFVGFAERGPINQPVLVTNWTQYSNTFGGLVDGAYLPHSVYGYFLNGGGSAYVVRIGTGTGPDGTTEHDDAERALLARAEVAAVGEDRKPAFTVQALERGALANDLSIEVVDASEPGEDHFKLLVFRGDHVVESFDNVSTKRGAASLAAAVRQTSKLISIEDLRTGSALTPVRNTKIALNGGDLPAVRNVTPGEYVGDVEARSGFAGLEAIDDITMLTVPDLMSGYQAGVIDDDGLKAVQLAMIAHCELMGDRVAILDPPPELTPQQMKEWRVDVAGYDSKYATLYWPWVKIMDPLRGQPIFVPPSGHIAGVWARNDETRGVHKAPANEVIRGVIDLHCGLTKGEHDQLNPLGINCVRSFPGQGIRIWGARTLSSDPEWRYLNVRRLFNFLEKSILQGTNWVVFEPNDALLWGSVRRNITMFLRRVWRSGALFGSSPEQAFFVKCDAENNPAENRDVGILTIDIGIAPVKPAEFVVFRLSQYAEGAGLEE